MPDLSVVLTENIGNLLVASISKRSVSGDLSQQC